MGESGKRWVADTGIDKPQCQEKPKIIVRQPAKTSQEVVGKSRSSSVTTRSRNVKVEVRIPYDNQTPPKHPVQSRKNDPATIGSMLSDESRARGAARLMAA